MRFFHAIPRATTLTLLVSLLGPASCAASHVNAPGEAELADWQNQPRWCYQSLGEIECYKEPQPEIANRLVAVTGVSAKPVSIKAEITADAPPPAAPPIEQPAPSVITPNVSAEKSKPEKSKPEKNMAEKNKAEKIKTEQSKTEAEPAGSPQKIVP